MSIFGGTRPQLSDAVFGSLVLRRHGWEGTIRSPAGEGTIWVRIERQKEGPQDADRTAMSALRGRYAALLPALADVLFSLWEPGANEPMWEKSWPTTHDELWSMLQLEGASIRKTGSVELLFSFKGEVWPDAMFNVEVNGAHVRALSLDD
jgi:hypothetical protein